MHVCARLCIYASGGQRSTLGIISHVPIYLACLSQGLSVTCHSSSRLSWLATSRQDLPVSAFSELRLQVRITMPGFSFLKCGLWGLDSGPQACMMSTLSRLPNLEFIFVNARYLSMSFWGFLSYVALEMWRLPGLVRESRHPTGLSLTP